MKLIEWYRNVINYIVPVRLDSDYVNFDMKISLDGRHKYRVEVLDSPVGQEDEKATLRFDLSKLTPYLKATNTPLRSCGVLLRHFTLEDDGSNSAPGATVLDSGKLLFETLFPGKVAVRYYESQRRAISDKKQLRVKLRIKSPELAVLPWELAYDAENREYVCLFRNTSLVRYLEMNNPTQPLMVKSRLRILGVISNPEGSVPLAGSRERSNMEDALAGLKKKKVERCWLVGPNWEMLTEKIREEGPWHIFHFIGHGKFDFASNEGRVALTSKGGGIHHLTSEKLASILEESEIRVAVLNSCEGASGSQFNIFSSTAATLTQRRVPAVVAMQSEITDGAAIEFSRAFYKALAKRSSIDAAVSAGRKAISLSTDNTIEWATPVLYLRSSDGVIFGPDDPFRVIKILILLLLLGTLFWTFLIAPFRGSDVIIANGNVSPPPLSGEPSPALDTTRAVKNLSLRTTNSCAYRLLEGSVENPGSGEKVWVFGRNNPGDNWRSLGFTPAGATWQKVIPVRFDNESATWFEVAAWVSMEDYPSGYSMRKLPAEGALSSLTIYKISPPEVKITHINNLKVNNLSGPSLSRYSGVTVNGTVQCALQTEFIYVEILGEDSTGNSTGRWVEKTKVKPDGDWSIQIPVIKDGETFWVYAGIHNSDPGHVNHNEGIMIKCKAR